MNKVLLFICSIVLIGSIMGCLRVTYDQTKAEIEHIDIDETLKVAVYELEEGGRDEALTIWAIRDQQITEEQAEQISELYFEYTKAMKDKYSLWHFTWAISNFYRNGDETIQEILQEAYDDAKEKATLTNSIADKYVNGNKIYMGHMHGIAHRYARNHVIAPGNERYRQSFDDYLDWKLDREEEEPAPKEDEAEATTEGETDTTVPEGTVGDGQTTTDTTDTEPGAEGETEGEQAGDTTTDGESTEPFDGTETPGDGTQPDDPEQNPSGPGAGEDESEADGSADGSTTTPELSPIDTPTNGS
jgi:hypothetical protein